MTPTDYFSLLICRHPSRTDVYLTGRPIGAIIDGRFEVASKVTPSGNRVAITADDLPHTKDLPTCGDLRRFVAGVLEAIPEDL